MLVGTRDCSRVVDGVLKQLDVVRNHLGGEVQLQGVLCFVEADWPLIGSPFTTQGVQVLPPKKLYPNLKAAGPLDVNTIATLHQTLASVLPSA